MKFEVSENFWDKFYRLPASEKQSVRKAWEIFKQDPFDGRLKAHRIHRLSAHYRRSVYSAVIEGDTVITLDVGSHDIYK